jgi:hypothetical protein
MNAVVQLEAVAKMPVTGQVTPMQLLQVAMNTGADLDRLQQLMNMQQQWEANQARKQFAEAMAAFKQSPPEISKDKHVSFTTSRGTTSYEHATLGNVCSAIVKALSQHGISHRWDLDQSNGRITVTCVLTHSAGHSEKTLLSSAPDDSGGKNSIQAIASAVTYLQRYTLLAATGTATNENDDDGRGTEREELPASRQATPAQRPNQTAAKPLYSDKAFQQNLPLWRGLVARGEKTPAAIISTVSTKAELTVDQKEAINNLKTEAK